MLWHIPYISVESVENKTIQHKTYTNNKYTFQFEGWNYGGVTYKVENDTKTDKKNKDVNVDFVKTSVLFDVLIELICSLVFAILLGVGGYFVYCLSMDTPVILFGAKIELTAGKLVEFVGYFENLIWPLIAMGQIISMRSRAKSSLKRITEFLDQEEDVKNPENAHVLTDVAGRITFKNFSFMYPDGTANSLEGVSFEITPGEIVGIVGKIGSGKTTLVNSLLRLYNVAEGTLFIDGHDIMQCDIASVREAISYVPQDNFLFSDTIANNIGFSKAEIDINDVRRASIASDVDENILEFTEQYETVLGERGVTVSGGQKQRISIARALMKNSQVLILDDSVSAVDTKTEETIIANLKKLREGKTTILIAHRITTVKKLDRIIVMDDGKIVGYGTHEELEQTCPLYKNMVFLQRLEDDMGEDNE